MQSLPVYRRSAPVRGPQDHTASCKGAWPRPPLSKQPLNETGPGGQPGGGQLSLAVSSRQLAHHGRGARSRAHGGCSMSPRDASSIGLFCKVRRHNQDAHWKWKSVSRARLFVTPWTIQSMEFSRPEYWSGSLSLLQGIFPTQRSNPDLPHCRWILYCLSHQGSPRILEWIAYPFSRGCSWLRSQNRVSCIAGGFFTSWATREAQRYNYTEINTRSKAIMKQQTNALQMKKNKTKLQKKN